MIFAFMLHTREENHAHCVDPRFSKIEKLIEELDVDEFGDKEAKSKKEELE